MQLKRGGHIFPILSLNDKGLNSFFFYSQVSVKWTIFQALLVSGVCPIMVICAKGLKNIVVLTISLHNGK